MKGQFILFISVSTTLALAPLNAHAQNTCGAAQFQLQQYVAQVNQVANFEYYQGIPQRCHGNQMCMANLLQQLNYWYQGQASQVNQWYSRIAMECTSETPSASDMPGRRARAGETDISEEAIDELEVANEDDTVAIVIPDTPSGFRPR